MEQWSVRLKKLIWILLFAFTAEAHAVTSRKEPTFGFIDLLMWQVRESGADNWGQLAISSGSKTLYRVLDAPFDWNTGVRIGFGHEFNQGGYDVMLAYTHYQTTASNQASGTVISSFDGNYFVNNLDGAALDIPYHSANIRYQFFFNTVDLNLGRNYKIDSVLEFHPYIGLKAASINQYIYSNWLNPVTPTTFTAGTENLKNNFSGMGPTLGVDSDWSIYNGHHQSVDLIGNLVGGLLYGHTTFSDVYSNNQPITITIHNNSINGASPMVGGFLGLQWSSQFAKSDISIRAGYEAQIWFNQVQFYSLNLGKIIRPLSLQGGDIEFRFNF
jgi:hypothetical protein